MQQKRARLFSNGILFLMLFALLFLIFHAEGAQAAAQEGLEICATSIIPSLFPFFVLSSLLLDFGFAQLFGRLLSPLMQPLFGLNGACASAIALGFIGGYPVGARTAAQLYRSGQCSRQQAERLLSFCNNAGPAFIFGVLGSGVFGGGLYGLALFIVHLGSALCVGLLGALFSRKKEVRVKIDAQTYHLEAKSFAQSFTQSVTGAFQSCLQICSFVILFTVIAKLLHSVGFFAGLADVIRSLPLCAGLDEAWIRSFCIGLLELSSGAWSLQNISSIAIAFVLASFMLAWGGLSVHCQSLSVLSDADLSVKPYLLGKLLQALIAAGLAGLVFRFLPITAEAASLLQPERAAPSLQVASLLPSVALLLLALPCYWNVHAMRRKD